VGKLIEMHMRPGEYTPQWSDAAIRRLMRDAGELLEPLLVMVEADIKAQRVRVRHAVPQQADLNALRERIAQIRAREDTRRWQSPLSGEELMHHFGLKPGPLVGKLKEALTNAVLEGRLAPNDKAHALQIARQILESLTASDD